MTMIEKNIILSNEKLDEFHQKLKSIIISNSLYLRPNLCLDGLSDESGISVEVVKQVLSEKLNLSFFEFISEYKVRRAKRLLTKIDDDHFSISNVAIESGFRTDEAFVALFKKQTHMSPEKYRIKYFNIDPDSTSTVTG